MTPASDEKWRPFNCFFSRVGLRTYQHPCILAIMAQEMPLVTMSHLCLNLSTFGTQFLQANKEENTIRVSYLTVSMSLNTGLEKFTGKISRSHLKIMADTRVT